MDYARKAREFFHRAEQEMLPMKIDKVGTVRVFDPASGAFAAYNANGTTKTFYVVNAKAYGYATAADYWNKQPGTLVRRP